MREAEHIIDAYRKGDAEERLCMFLKHRSFRDEFIRIDQEEGGGDRIG